MNKDQLIGKWQQLKGEALKQWGKLTRNKLDEIEGDRTKLIGLIRESYGIAKAAAEQEIESFLKRGTY